MHHPVYLCWIPSGVCERIAQVQHPIDTFEKVLRVIIFISALLNNLRPSSQTCSLNSWPIINIEGKQTSDKFDKVLRFIQTRMSVL